MSLCKDCTPAHHAIILKVDMALARVRQETELLPMPFQISDTLIKYTVCRRKAWLKQFTKAKNKIIFGNFFKSVYLCL